MARRRDHNTDSPFTDALSQINGYKTLKPPKYISITSYRGHNMIFQVCSEFCSLFLLLAFPSVLVSAWSYLFLPRTLWSPAFWSRPFGTAAPTLLHINYCLCPARQCNMDWRLQTGDWGPCQVQGFIKKKKKKTQTMAFWACPRRQKSRPFSSRRRRMQKPSTGCTADKFRCKPSDHGFSNDFQVGAAESRATRAATP